MLKVANYRGGGAGGNEKLDAKILFPPEDNTIILDPPTCK
jgi:hypothetical protein